MTGTQVNVINNQERLNVDKWAAKSPESCDLTEDSGSWSPQLSEEQWFQFVR